MLATIADAINRHATGVRDVLICGGGVHNRELVRRLGDRLPRATLASTANFGLDPDHGVDGRLEFLLPLPVLGQPAAQAGDQDVRLVQRHLQVVHHDRGPGAGHERGGRRAGGSGDVDVAVLGVDVVGGRAVVGVLRRDEPVEIEEAAIVDGASRLRIFLSIVIPLTAPALVALATSTR